jgi:membrane protease YdiL (CAAX protease family)
MADRGVAEAGRVRLLLAVEFAALYLGLPLALALLMPTDWLWPVFFGATALALALLAATPGFAWAELARGWRRLDWRPVVGMAAVTAAVAGALVWALVPGQAFGLPRRDPALWLAIMALYPLLSAAPQEVLFRVLFFRRYGALFPSRRAGVAASAFVFAFAHLVFWNWVSLALTFGGGAIFARAYLGRGGFALAVALHAVAGAIVFTSGLGSFFYHGAVGR